MLELFVYPVSAVMKLWHLILHTLIGMDASTAWILSIFGLIITVRALIAPMSWIQKRSARKNVLMRPEMAALTKKYGDSTDPDEILAHQREQKELRKRYNYSYGAGCIPPLIQIPVFLGLYRLLLWLGLPDSHESASGAVGILSASDVVEFQEASIFGVPVAAYLAMPQERLATLGTTVSDVQALVVPLLIAAVLFTALNMAIALVWSWQTMDWSSSISRRIYWVLVALAVFAPVFILLFGLFGPVPVALVVYWFANNLWTLGQNAIMTWQIAQRFPESEEHKAKRQTDRQLVLAERAQAKEEKLALQERKREIRRAPQEEAARMRAELADARRTALDAKNAEEEQAKVEVKERRLARQKARMELRRRAKKAQQQNKEQPGQDQME